MKCAALSCLLLSGVLSGCQDREACADNARLETQLETLRQADGRYPAASQFILPESCLDLRVCWRVPWADAYRFGVSDVRGRVLAEQSGP